MDNTIMIYAGEFIDENLGVVLGLSTMASAAAGQVLSDFSGVCFGGSLEAAASRLGLPYPEFTDAQRQMRSVKFIGVAGAALGVVFGCLMGMCNLLLLDTGKVERHKKQGELRTIFRSFALDGPEQFQAERCTLYLVDRDREHVFAIAKRWQITAAQLDEVDIDLELLRKGEVADGAIARALLDRNMRKDEVVESLMKSHTMSRDEFSVHVHGILERDMRSKLTPGGTKYIAIHTGKLVNVKDVFTHPQFVLSRKHTTARVRTRASSVLVCPVLSRRDGTVLGVLEVINKTSADGLPIVFGELDEGLARMLCSHVASMIDTICEDEAQVVEFLT